MKKRGCTPSGRLYIGCFAAFRQKACFFRFLPRYTETGKTFGLPVQPHIDNGTKLLSDELFYQTRLIYTFFAENKIKGHKSRISSGKKGDSGPARRRRLRFVVLYILVPDIRCVCQAVFLRLKTGIWANTIPREIQRSFYNYGIKTENYLFRRSE